MTQDTGLHSRSMQAWKGENVKKAEERKIRNRYFCAILYEDDLNFKKYFDNIMKKFEEVTYIKHDKDIEENENGEEKKKKTHIHILFKVGENARSLISVAKDIEIPSNYLQGCNKKAMLLYLIHANNPEKTQYPIEEVKGELKEELIKMLLDRVPDEKKLEQIIGDIICSRINDITTLMLYSLENNCTSTMRKYQFILLKLIEERQKYERLYKRRNKSRT